MNNSREVAIVATSTGAVTAITVLFVYISIATHDAEYLNRGGATILALTALFVVWQVTREAALESTLERLHATGNLQTPVPTLSEPSVVTRMKTLARARVRIDIKGVRMVYVWLVAIMTAFGEFLHGWGDLILIALGVAGHR